MKILDLRGQKRRLTSRLLSLPYKSYCLSVTEIGTDWPKPIRQQKKEAKPSKKEGFFSQPTQFPHYSLFLQHYSLYHIPDSNNITF